MDFFKKLNDKLDEGYKLTNTNCPNCQRTIIYHIENKEFFCIQCNLPVKLENQVIETNDLAQDQEKEVIIQTQKIQNQNDEKNEKNEDFKTQKNKFNKSSLTSAKMGQKLLQGWTMLEQTCEVCFTPIMRSRQFEYVCCSCDWSKFIKQDDEEGLRKIGRPPYNIVLQEQRSPVVQNSDLVENNGFQDLALQNNENQLVSQQNQQNDTKIKKEEMGKNKSQQNEPSSRLLLQLYSHYENRLKILIQKNDTKQIDQLMMNELTRLFELDAKMRGQDNKKL